MFLVPFLLLLRIVTAMREIRLSRNAGQTAEHSLSAILWVRPLPSSANPSINGVLKAEGVWQAFKMHHPTYSWGTRTGSALHDVLSIQKAPARGVQAMTLHFSQLLRATL